MSDIKPNSQELSKEQYEADLRVLKESVTENPNNPVSIFVPVITNFTWEPALNGETKTIALVSNYGENIDNGCIVYNPAFVHRLVKEADFGTFYAIIATIGLAIKCGYYDYRNGTEGFSHTKAVQIMMAHSGIFNTIKGNNAAFNSAISALEQQFEWPEYMGPTMQAFVNLNTTAVQDPNDPSGQYTIEKPEFTDDDWNLETIRKYLAIAMGGKSPQSMPQAMAGAMSQAQQQAMQQAKQQQGQQGGSQQSSQWGSVRQQNQSQGQQQGGQQQSGQQQGGQQSGQQGGQQNPQEIARQATEAAKEAQRGAAACARACNSKAGQLAGRQMMQASAKMMKAASEYKNAAESGDQQGMETAAQNMQTAAQDIQNAKQQMQQAMKASGAKSADGEKAMESGSSNCQQASESANSAGQQGSDSGSGQQGSSGQGADNGEAVKQQASKSAQNARNAAAQCAKACGNSQDAKNAQKTIEEGAQKLEEGANEYAEGAQNGDTKQMQNGVNKMKEGNSKIQEGTKKMQEAFNKAMEEGGQQGGDDGSDQGGKQDGKQGGKQGGQQGGEQGGDQDGDEGFPGSQGGQKGGQKGGKQGGQQGGDDGDDQGGDEGFPGGQGGQKGGKQGGKQGGQQGGDDGDESEWVDEGFPGSSRGGQKGGKQGGQQGGQQGGDDGDEGEWEDEGFPGSSRGGQKGGKQGGQQGGQYGGDDGDGSEWEDEGFPGGLGGKQGGPQGGPQGGKQGGQQGGIEGFPSNKQGGPQGGGEGFPVNQGGTSVSTQEMQSALNQLQQAAQEAQEAAKGGEEGQGGENHIDFIPSKDGKQGGKQGGNEGFPGKQGGQQGGQQGGETEGKDQGGEAGAKGSKPNLGEDGESSDPSGSGSSSTIGNLGGLQINLMNEIEFKQDKRKITGMNKNLAEFANEQNAFSQVNKTTTVGSNTGETMENNLQGVINSINTNIDTKIQHSDETEQQRMQELNALSNEQNKADVSINKKAHLKVASKILRAAQAAQLQSDNESGIKNYHRPANTYFQTGSTQMIEEDVPRVLIAIDASGSMWFNPNVLVGAANLLSSLVNYLKMPVDYAFWDETCDIPRPYSGAVAKNLASGNRPSVQKYEGKLQTSVGGGGTNVYSVVSRLSRLDANRKPRFDAKTIAQHKLRFADNYNLIIIYSDFEFPDNYSIPYNVNDVKRRFGEVPYNKLVCVCCSRNGENATPPTFKKLLGQRWVSYKEWQDAIDYYSHAKK